MGWLTQFVFVNLCYFSLILNMRYAIFLFSLTHPQTQYWLHNLTVVKGALKSKGVMNDVKEVTTGFWSSSRFFFKEKLQVRFLEIHSLVFELNDSFMDGDLLSHYKHVIDLVDRDSIGLLEVRFSIRYLGFHVGACNIYGISFWHKRKLDA